MSWLLGYTFTLTLLQYLDILVTFPFFFNWSTKSILHRLSPSFPPKLNCIGLHFIVHCICRETGSWQEGKRVLPPRICFHNSIHSVLEKEKEEKKNSSNKTWSPPLTLLLFFFPPFNSTTIFLFCFLSARQGRWLWINLLTDIQCARTLLLPSYNLCICSSVEVWRLGAYICNTSKPIWGCGGSQRGNKYAKLEFNYWKLKLPTNP